jgi:ABC-2 type transport system ATP-binding protein
MLGGVADYAIELDAVTKRFGDSQALRGGTVSVPAPDGVGTLSEVFGRVGELGVGLNDISLRKPSLDEVFFKLTGAAPADAEDAVA